LVSYFPVANYSFQTASFQWGGWIDTLIDNADIAAGESTAARRLVGNRVDVDSVTAPTVLTYYADDSTTPLSTRTIANADGSPVSPAQVLVLGRAS
jgi:hypothetical protein